MFEHQVHMDGIGVVTALQMVEEVEKTGLVREQDFIWRYIPGKLDALGIYTVSPRAVEFEFKEAAWATFFRLKWLK